jgi:hypothetical protein
MSVQMWLVAPKETLTDASSAEIQRFVRSSGGIILMVTRGGPLVLLDDDAAPTVEKHPLVAFVGPVHLNPRGVAADRLQQIFMDNITKQIDLSKLAETDPLP